MRPGAAALVVVLLLAGCREGAASRAQGCPPEAAVAALHASAFFFQNGPVASAQARLAQARALLEAAEVDATTRALLAGLSSLAALPPGAADERARGAERLRVALADWQCLPAARHEALHRALPPLPHAG